MYDIQKKCDLKILKNNKNIFGIYKENRSKDHLELIASIELEDDDKVVPIHLRKVYSMIKFFQVSKIIVEIKYKIVDKKKKNLLQSFC